MRVNILLERAAICEWISFADLSFTGAYGISGYRCHIFVVLDPVTITLF